MIATNPDLARTELLITLEYLMRFSDEAHPASQTKIIDYGYQKYEHTIRRQRLPEILDYLYRNTKETAGWPFSVERVSTGQRYKYYMDKRMLTSSELKTIIDALVEDNYLDEEASRTLITKLLSAHTSEAEGEKIINDEQRIRLAPFKYHKVILQRYERVVEAIAKKQIVTFEFFGSDTLTYLRNKESPIEDELFPQSGNVRRRPFTSRYYVYKVVEFNNMFYAMCGNISEQKLMTFPLDSVRIVNIEESFGLAPALNELITDFNYPSVEDYLADVLVPTGTYPIDIVFTFQNSIKGTMIERINRVYRRYFGKDMDYTVSELKKIKAGTRRGGTPRYVNEHYIVTVNARMGLNSFLEFVQHPKVIDVVTIVSPAILNKKLYNIYARLAKRYKGLIRDE